MIDYSDPSLRSGQAPDEEPGDDEFPTGDGTADDAAVVTCPYCGEEVEITLDPGGEENQEYIEDCEVCCRPWTVTVHYGSGGAADVRVERLE